MNREASKKTTFFRFSFSAAHRAYSINKGYSLSEVANNKTPSHRRTNVWCECTILIPNTGLPPCSNQRHPELQVSVAIVRVIKRASHAYFGLFLQGL